MKKIYLSVTILLSLSNLLKAQNASPYWSLAGNSNATSTSKLGTTNGINLRLYTNNLERARITTSGLVGIGTTNPVTKLHVNGFGSFGSSVTTLNATRALNLADANAVIRVLRVHPTYAPAVELISRTSADGPNVAYWDAYAQPTDASFRIRDRQSGDHDRLTIQHATGNVGIGTATPSSKLHVVGNATITNGLNVEDNGITGNNNTDLGVGVMGQATTGYGLYGGASTDPRYGGGTGVYGIGTTGVSGTGTTGVIGQGSDSYPYGGGVGVYGIGYEEATGIKGTSTSGYAGEFIGNVSVTGEIFQTSDKTLKKNIQELGNAMSIIDKLKPKNYEFRNDGKFASLNLPKGNHYGLIAQELEEVLPNLVKESRHQIASTNKLNLKPTSDGKLALPGQQKEAKETVNTKAVNYIELIPIIIKAMQEQEATIQKQNGEIEELTQLVTKLSLNSNTSGSVKSAGGSLAQNTPNPNIGSTRINYNIPPGTTRAELVINNTAGQKVEQIQLDKSGVVDIDTSKFSTGTYFYTLFVNGTSVDTKKMIIARQ